MHALSNHHSGVEIYGVAPEGNLVGMTEYKKAILNFSYVIPNALAGMAMPGAVDSLDKDLDFLLSEGVRAILSLSESPLDEELVRGKGFLYCHVPINDFTAPTIEQVDKCIRFIDQMLTIEDKPVVVHCGAGCGRTGAVLGCYLVRRGRTAERAIGELRLARPCSIETESQRALVYQYEEHLKYRPSAD